MTIQERETAINEFVSSCIGNYSVKFDIHINDDSSLDATAFEVVVTNDYNKKKVIIILSHLDYEGGIEILHGEEFYSTDERDFIMSLFLELFL